MNDLIEMRVLAGVVLYNPDFDRLCLCLDGLNGQVEQIILYDNSAEKMEFNRIEFLCTHYNCQYIYARANLGMPEALNKIMEIAEELKYEWVLTMNPDSIVPIKMVDEYRKYFNIEKIGIICPQVVDKRRKYMTVDTAKRNQYIKMCITSGACTKVSAWRQVGGFDGWLFVDLLDNDISKRMVLNGWKILQINSIVMDQEFGDIRPRSKRTEKFWIGVGRFLHNENFAKFSYKKIVHPNRVYYTCRNIVYLNSKFKHYGGIGYEENYNCHTFMGFLVCFVLPSIMRADKKGTVFKAVVNGFRDGRKNRVVPWEATPI